ncbi:zinc metalloprotease [Actinomadura madurae]|uniref:zinc metalloprotease n=1 Tax=Actinomadura madurae TaxID=1993 RepID=UPI002025E4FB|nr:zinc metalloprotease [Actinomadura madurae]URM99150.1 zinc metalloprotease [Actinomadura madurae]
MRRIAGASLCALLVTVSAVSGSVSDRGGGRDRGRDRVRAASAVPDDGCVPGSAARAARPHDRADLGHDGAVALLADLRRTLLDRFGTSDIARLDGTRLDASRLDPSRLDPSRLDPSRLDGARRIARRLVVPVRFHVVHSGRYGRLSKKALRRQIATLNAAYSGRKGGADTRVRFRLSGYDRTNKPSWFYHPQHYEHAMKRRLRKGGRGTLNVYTASVGAEVLGFSTFPQWYRRDPRMDGVVVDYRSLPRGSYAPFNHGYTGVHEIGHWLGLMHTFEGGCTPPGDGVADTPYEAVPAEGCPRHRDTCPQRGRDPVHNFMDYAHDSCMRGFTAGQGRLIRASWAAYRSRRHGRHRVDPGTAGPGAARSVGGAR